MYLYSEVPEVQPSGSHDGMRGDESHTSQQRDTYYKAEDVSDEDNGGDSLYEHVEISQLYDQVANDDYSVLESGRSN